MTYRFPKMNPESMMMRRLLLRLERHPACRFRWRFSTATPSPTPSTGAAAAESGSGSNWERRLKIAGAVLVPVAIPAAVVAGIVYDPELREDVDKFYPEIVDAVRVHVGFEEDLDARVRSLEQAFIMSQPLAVTVRMRTGGMYTQTVSPLGKLHDLYQALETAPSDRPIVALDFDDISREEVKDPASRPAESEPDESDLLLLKVPPALRNSNKSSLWDQHSSSVIQATKQQAPPQEDVLKELKMLLGDIDESLQALEQELQTGQREIDQVMAEIQDLKQRRKEVQAELRRKGGWWRLF